MASASSRMGRGALSQRLLYGLLVGLFTWYATLLPIVLMGYWRSKLVPSLGIFAEFFHVWLVIAIWTFGASRRAVLVTAVVVGVVIFLVSTFVFNGDPGLPYLAKYGWTWYLQMWAMLILSLLVAPTLVALILLRADWIAPKILKNWRPIDA